VDPLRSGSDPPLGQRNRLAGALDHRVVVAALQAHGSFAEHIHGGDHLD